MGNSATGGNVFGASRLRGMRPPLETTPEVPLPIVSPIVNPRGPGGGSVPPDTISGGPGGGIPIPQPMPQPPSQDGIISDLVKGPRGEDWGSIRGDEGRAGGNMPMPGLPPRQVEIPGRGLPETRPRGDDWMRGFPTPEKIRVPEPRFIGDMANRPLPPFRPENTLEVGAQTRGGRTSRKRRAKGPGGFVTNMVNTGRIGMY